MSKLLVPLFVVVATVVARADDLPRYRLEPGLVLMYESHGGMKFEGGSHRTGATSELYIVRKNDDGSFKVLEIQKLWYTSGDEPRGDEDTEVGVADIAPDGTVTTANEFSRSVFEGSFPSLPTSAAEIEAGWSRKGPYGSETRYTAAKTGSADDFVFDAVATSPEDAIYLLARNTTIHFDRAAGQISRFESQYSQGHGFVGKGSGTTVLKSQERKDAEFVSQLDQDVTVYESATQKYIEFCRLGEKDEAKLDEAVAVLQSAAGVVRTPALKSALDTRIAQHNQYIESSKEQARKKAKLLGKPAVDFTLEDTDGQKLALADLKGKVVVLDFWYRGCGWCIRAMTQIKQLTDDFKDMPVVILGMNTDRKLEDAKFVIEKMGLNYRTLRTTHEFADSCGVRTFPTLIVIDQAGNVADFHVGYSKDLRETVGKQIDGLLERSTK